MIILREGETPPSSDTPPLRPWRGWPGAIVECDCRCQFQLQETDTVASHLSARTLEDGSPVGRVIARCPSCHYAALAEYALDCGSGDPSEGVPVRRLDD